jgi:hypothetical protein
MRLLTDALDLLAGLEGAVLELQGELLGRGGGEALHDHLGVGVEDAVHREAGSLHGCFVHFVLIIIIPNQTFK